VLHLAASRLTFQCCTVVITIVEADKSIIEGLEVHGSEVIVIRRLDVFHRVILNLHVLSSRSGPQVLQLEIFRLHVARDADGAEHVAADHGLKVLSDWHQTH
jgi:hypothetical protein